MASREVRDLDSYSSKLAKLIPGEVTAAYLAINSLVSIDDGMSWVMITSLVILAIFCPLYLWKLQNVRNVAQIAFTTAAFPLWALNISYPRIPSIPQGVLGTALILATLAIPLISPTQEQGT
jgi:hypothetical protein